MPRPGPRLMVVASVGAVALILVALISGWHEGVLWPGSSILGLLIGCGFVFLTYRIWQSSRRFALGATVAVVGCLVIGSLAALVQSPGRVGDPYHLKFTSDEVAAVAAGTFR